MGRENLKEKKNIIYVFTISRFEGAVKVGESSRSSNKKMLPRINEQVQGLPIIDEDDTIQEELRFPSSFKDTQIHEQLKKMGFKQYKNVNGKPTEWFNCTPEDAIIADLILSGYPVAHWTSKEKENLYEFKKMLEELKDENDTRNIKEQIKDLKRVIQEVKEFYGYSKGTNISLKNVKEFPEVIERFILEHKLPRYEIVSILRNLETLTNYDLLNIFKKFKEEISGLSSLEVELFLKLLNSYDYELYLDESPQQVINDIFNYFTELYNNGIKSHADLQKCWKKMESLKKLKKVTTDIILEKLIPEETYPLDYFKDKICRFKKHSGEKWLDVLKKDRSYLNFLIKLSLNNISEYVSLLRIDEKELDSIID